MIATAVMVAMTLMGLSWRPAPASSGEMPTVAKKPAARRRAPAKKPVAAAPRPRLTPPPGRKASEIADLLPPPSADFDAEAVARVVACRADR